MRHARAARGRWLRGVGRGPDLDTWAKAQAIDPTYGGLNSVSCTSATECRAANNQARVLHFDGRSWTGGRRFATPAQVADGATLTAMTCATGSFCAADVTSSA